MIVVENYNVAFLTHRFQVEFELELLGTKYRQTYVQEHNQVFQGILNKLSRGSPLPPCNEGRSCIVWPSSRAKAAFLLPYCTSSG